MTCHQCQIQVGKHFGEDVFGQKMSLKNNK